MSAYDLIVIGGGPAGHSAAAAYREAGGRGTVLVLAGEEHAPYERPPLSKDLLRGESEPDALPMRGARLLRASRGVEVRHAEAAALDAGGRVVTLADGEALAFERCVLATGAQPLRPSIAGADAPGVHLLRTIDHALGPARRRAPGRPRSSSARGSSAARRPRRWRARLRGDAGQPGARAAGGAAR